MIALYLIAAHFTGDYLLQSRWMAGRKLKDPVARLAHVSVYCLPFVALMGYLQPSQWHTFGFLSALFVLHYATDSHRFTSNPACVVEWWIRRWRDKAVPTRAWVDYLYRDQLPPAMVLGQDKDWRVRKARELAGRTLWFPPPNPWPPTSVVVDQSLHIVQLAVLGGLFLR